MKLPRFLLKLRQFYKEHLALEDSDMDDQRSSSDHMSGGLNTTTKKKSKDKEKIKEDSNFSIVPVDDPKRAKLFEAWYDGQKVPDANEIPVKTDAKDLLETHGIDILSAPEIVSLFISHKAEPVPWRVVRELAQLYRYVPDKTKIYPAFAHHFEKQIPATQRHYGSKLKATDVELIRKKLLEGSLDEVLSTYSPIYRRTLPENAEHRKMLEVSPYGTPKPKSSTGDCSSNPSAQATAKNDNKRKQISESSVPPVHYPAISSVLPRQENHVRSHAFNINTVSVGASIRMRRSQLELRRLQAHERLERQRIELDQESIRVEEHFQQESKMLDDMENAERREIDNAIAISGKAKKD